MAKDRTLPFSLYIAGLFLLISSVDLNAATYYVSTLGNNGDVGGISTPWRTLQKAADTVVGGDLVLVATGDYDEVVTVNRSGSGQGSQIIFRSLNQYGAKVTGFKLQGDYITVDGFTLEASTANEYGIIVNGHHHDTIINCHVLECPKGGINIGGGSSHCNVVSNKLEHNGQWGIRVDGSNILIEDNEILGTVQHHPKIPFTGYHGEDADGIRIFGGGHMVRGNYLHDLGNVEDPGNHQATSQYPGDYPHVDCLQSWDRSGHHGPRVMNHGVIENNRCSLSRASGKGVMISAVDNGCTDITVANNIFEYRDIGIAMDEGTFSNIFIYHNVFKANLDDPPWGTALYLKNITNYKVLNNIMVDGHAEARKIIGGSGVVDYNLVWYSNGATPVGIPGAGEHEIWGDDPGFLNYIGTGGGDYHLQKDSPAIDHGIALAAIQTDISGNVRPAGAYDIGPYEYNNRPGNAMRLLQVLTGEVPDIDFTEIPDVDGNGTYGMAEVFSLLHKPGTPAVKKIFGSKGMPDWEPVFTPATSIGTSEISRWKYGKQSALTISFDDSAIGNALHGVPEMGARGIVGTWFVNPGNSSFQKMSSVWHQAAVEYGQEVANHTMRHSGGATELEALAAINDASEYIKEHIYHVLTNSKKILGFNKAGGTNWDIPTTGDAWEQRMRENYLVERKYSTGFYKAMPFEEMRMVVKSKSYRTNWNGIHLHGICDDDNNGRNNPLYGPSYVEVCTCTHIPPEGCGAEPDPADPDYQNKWLEWASCRFSSGYSKSVGVADCKDGGLGAVKKTELFRFFDYLVDPDEIAAQKIWIAGFAEAKKYEIEKNNSVVSVIEAGATKIRLNLTMSTVAMAAPLDQVELYDGELTLFTKVPATWSACRVSQNGQSYTYRISNGETRFEVFPNGGEIVLENDEVANINIPYVGDS